MPIGRQIVMQLICVFIGLTVLFPIIWIVLTPVFVTIGGQLINQAEQIRSQVGSSLFAQAAGGAPGAIFGSTASDMPSPKALYPSNPCGRGTLVRRDEQERPGHTNRECCSIHG
jgi:hypothetical protein